MLSDLTQYFTNKKNLPVADNEVGLPDILRFFYEYTSIDEIKNNIERNVIFDPEPFHELNDVWFDDMYMSDYHLGDCLEIAYENNLLQMVFSTFFEEHDFSIEYIDSDIYILFDDERGNDIKMENFLGLNLSRKIEKFVNTWLKDEIEKYFSIDGKIDDYTGEIARVVFMNVTFENKSIARKMRKAYSNNDFVRDMFDNLNIWMKNGEFITLFIYNAEAGPCGDYIDFETIITGIEEVREILGVTNKNTVGHSFDIALRNLNIELGRDMYEKDNYYVFFNSILRNHFAPKGEVIL